MGGSGRLRLRAVPVGTDKKDAAAHQPGHGYTMWAWTLALALVLVHHRLTLTTVGYVSPPKAPRESPLLACVLEETVSRARRGGRTAEKLNIKLDLAN